MSALTLVIQSSPGSIDLFAHRNETLMFLLVAGPLPVVAVVLHTESANEVRDRERERHGARCTVGERRAGSANCRARRCDALSLTKLVLRDVEELPRTRRAAELRGWSVGEARAAARGGHQSARRQAVRSEVSRAAERGGRELSSRAADEVGVRGQKAR